MTRPVRNCSRVIVDIPLSPETAGMLEMMVRTTMLTTKTAMMPSAILRRE